MFKLPAGLACPIYGLGADGPQLFPVLLKDAALLEYSTVDSSVVRTERFCRGQLSA